MSYNNVSNLTFYINKQDVNYKQKKIRVWKSIIRVEKDNVSKQTKKKEYRTEIKFKKRKQILLRLSLPP